MAKGPKMGSFSSPASSFSSSFNHLHLLSLDRKQGELLRTASYNSHNAI